MLIQTRVLTAIAIACLFAPILSVAQTLRTIPVDPIADDSPELGCSLREAIDLANAGLLSAICLLYTSPSPRDLSTSRMPSSA